MIKLFLTYEEDYCNVSKVILGTHTGTHIDEPYHFLKDGLKITADDLKMYLEDIENIDFIIFKTSMDKLILLKKIKSR